MSAKILSGTVIKDTIMAELRGEIKKIKEKYGKSPGLATILAGENPASLSYVSLKIRTALELGFHEVQTSLPQNISEDELLKLISTYNKDPLIHGILVQLPLPKHIDERKIIHAIHPDKDVDAFHPINLGRLVLGEALFLPCTPAGIQEMLIRTGISTSGAEVVIVGRSNIVGRPLSIMLGQKGQGADATVTLVHTKSQNLAKHCQRADILIVAAGSPGLVKAEWIKPGAAIIDVGVNRVGINPKTGKAILSGDVDFVRAREIAGYISPVPGGVGPMTIAMLMKNTVRAAHMHLAQRLK